MRSKLFNTATCGNIYCDRDKIDKYDGGNCPMCGKMQLDQDDPEFTGYNEISVVHRCPDDHEWTEVYRLDRVFFERPEPVYEVWASHGPDAHDETNSTLLEDGVDVVTARATFTQTVSNVLDGTSDYKYVAIFSVDVYSGTDTVAEFHDCR